MENTEQTISYPQNIADSRSNIVFMTNPDKVIDQLENSYRCIEEKIENGKLYIHQYGDPLMNDEGIKSVLGQVRSIVNQNTIMTNIDKNGVILLMDSLADTLAKDLMVNRKRYNIINASARDKIYSEALHISYITLRRPYEQGDRKFWKNTMQEVHTVVQKPNEKKGLFNFFK